MFSFNISITAWAFSLLCLSVCSGLKITLCYGSQPCNTVVHLSDECFNILHLTFSDLSVSRLPVKTNFKIIFRDFALIGSFRGPHSCFHPQTSVTVRTSFIFFIAFSSVLTMWSLHTLSNYHIGMNSLTSTYSKVQALDLSLVFQLKHKFVFPNILGTTVCVYHVA